MVQFCDWARGAEEKYGDGYVVCKCFAVIIERVFLSEPVEQFPVEEFSTVNNPAVFILTAYGVE